MKCPLIAIVMTSRVGAPLGNESSCLQEECAWWSGIKGECAVINISDALDDLHYQLKQINVVMRLLR